MPTSGELNTHTHLHPPIHIYIDTCKYKYIYMQLYNSSRMNSYYITHHYNESRVISSLRHWYIFDLSQKFHKAQILLKWDIVSGLFTYIILKAGVCNSTTI